MLTILLFLASMFALFGWALYCLNHADLDENEIDEGY